MGFPAGPQATAASQDAQSRGEAPGSQSLLHMFQLCNLLKASFVQLVPASFCPVSASLLDTSVQLSVVMTVLPCPYFGAGSISFNLIKRKREAWNCLQTENFDF